MKRNIIIGILYALYISAFIMYGFVGCSDGNKENTADETTTAPDSTFKTADGCFYKTIIMDSCEYVLCTYIFSDDGEPRMTLTHKGNCGYCKRMKQNNE